LAPRRAGPAVALAGALGLAACSSTPEPPPPACPAALFLDGAEQTAVYTPGAGAEPRPDQLRYLAVLTDLSSACRYDDDSSAPGVDVDLSFKVIAERGPALMDREEVTYFVATVAPDRRILARDTLGGDLPFEDKQQVGLSENLTLRLPSITPAQAPYYTLLIGFQLDDEELRRREQPLLR
jgi:hypothetical protein